MATIEESKKKVAQIFNALAPGHRAAWRELVNGGFECSLFLEECSITAFVDTYGCIVSAQSDSAGAYVILLRLGAYGSNGTVSSPCEGASKPK